MRLDLLPTSFEGKLARLLEESAEVLKCIGKIQRFGIQAYDSKTNIRYDNVADLQEEMKHLKHAIEEMEKYLAENSV